MSKQLIESKSNYMKSATIAIFSSVLLMSGCATKPTYQGSGNGPTILVDNRGVPNYYKVKSGDTVSHIAARYGLNYRQIGALNNLDSRYTIYAGQWLKLWDRRGTSPAVINNPVRQPTTSVQTPPRQNPPTSNQTDYSTPTLPAQGYGYPTSNPVIKNFDANTGESSMWFSGRVGDPVLASKGGHVLYAGNGLPEYGNLVMIRHDDTYITVYAHNNELLVKEGDTVRTGQRIATMGSSGQTNQVALQFQLRENGTPIDPRAVLGL